MTLSIGGRMAYAVNAEEVQRKIVIDIPSRRLSILENNQIVKEYQVAVGKSNSQTPIGDFQVVNKAINPYYGKLKIPGGNLNNPLGTRWLGFLIRNGSYGIHGNSNPDSIGTFASAGCVRMYERDVQEVYEIILKGTPVSVIYEPLKILYDVDDQNPILLAYPDYYNKEPNFYAKIDEKLKEINLLQLIPKDRLDSLKKSVNNQVTVFSDKWTYFINGKYVSNDLFLENGVTYIEKSKVEKFFNIEIPSNFNENTCDLLGNNLSEKIYGNKKYLLTKELEGIIGGEHKINENTQRVDFDIKNYILVNNKLVLGKTKDNFTSPKVKDLFNNPKISLLSLSKALNINIHSTKEDTRFTYNGKVIETTFDSNVSYVETKKLENSLGFSTDIYTYDSHIEITIDPKIIYEGVAYQGKILNKNIYLPYEIYEKASGMKQDSYQTDLPVFYQKPSIRYINKIGYVKLQDIQPYTITVTDPYFTKMYIERRII